MKINPMQDEMQNIALEMRSLGRTETSQEVNQDFGTLLSSAIQKVNGLQKTSSDLAVRFDRGDRSLSLSDVMIASNKSSVAFEATVQTRNKLVEAYKELMNMPV
ncbi:flagellar hook-basal body complex protein FliE [Candidatus Enterovibrio escicola]|uniref:Flagellar hook-basal body complex protein FliE n=1 Tax=Candidatus Enterovibrio escicola TaxID=1927127 RepID=A0A2A5T1E2_9GAMM|nr:flagellar hook-basal body complex protein FliE [Candidatus Enterovibrio escacola]PCS21985.1 Flagellar hook-basal body complex protein FliE [Candidatus Enterovibrio escacola]